MTALKAHEVARFLTSPDLQRGLYLAYGSDGGLVRETAQTLIHYFAGNPPDSMAHTTLDTSDLDTDPDRLSTEARTASLFGGRRTLRIRGTSKSVTAGVALLLEDMPDAIIVVEAGNLAKGDALRSLAESSKWARALPCYADNERALGDLVRKTLSDAGIRCEQEVFLLLRGLLGNDREITRRELEKLVLFADASKHLSVADVEALCGDNSGLAVDAIIDAVAGGNAGAFDNAYRAAIAAGADTQRFLPVALMHFANLRRMRLSVDDGKSAKAVVDAARPRVHFSRAAAVEQQLRLWPDTALSSACIRIHDAVLESRRSAKLSAPITQRALLAVCLSASQR